MDDNFLKILPEFLTTLGLDEEPMGIFYTDQEPVEGFSPKPNDLPTREKEMENKIDRWFELKEATSEYRQLDKYIKETFREKEKIIVGDYMITGAFTSDKKWKTKIQHLGG